MRLLLLVFLLITTACGDNKESKFPSKDVTVIIPNAPGGGTDRSVRGLLDVAKKYTDAQFIVENRPGAATAIGTSTIANAKADGYTLGAATVELAILPHIGQMPVDYTAFRPLVFTIGEPSVITIRSGDTRFKNFAELIAYAKSNPKKLKVGTTGFNSIWYIAAVLLQQSLGIKLTIIPYEGGSADAVAALVGGHVDLTTVGPATVKSQVDAGALKMLAILAKERSKLFPNLATIDEFEPVEPFTIRAWALMVLPKNVNDEIYKYWKDIFTKASKDPEFIELLTSQGLIIPLHMDNVEQVLKDDNDLYKSVVKSLL